METTKNSFVINSPKSLPGGYKFYEFIFYGNYFYGICTVALSIEAMLQQQVPLNGFLYFCFVFLSTILYYTYPYVRKCSLLSSNRRTNWYTKNYDMMRWSQIIITVILFIASLLFLKNYSRAILALSLGEWCMIGIFPLVAAFYYGLDSLSGKYNLRKIGWLKPFIIGFIWAGMVTIYPVLFYDMINGLSYTPKLITGLLFLKNFMFITLLCIIFDVKDYATDYINRLKTFVVELGLRRTIFYLLVPLTIAGLATFMYYAVTHQFRPMKIILNTIPFALLVMAAYSLRKRRSILYYLIVIDGLMLVKALCGSVAMIYF